LESLTYRKLKALAKEFDIPLEIETRRGIEKVTTSDEMIDVILQFREQTKDQIIEFTVAFERQREARKEAEKEEREAKRKLRKAVKCPSCGSADVELKEITPLGERGIEAGLGSLLRGRRKKIEQRATYYCKECRETFQRPVKSAD